ncbi:aldo/keto reductase [Saccharibacillus sp. O23]|uniref:aldo/keto reductase n=1 Tax=Saccharibacillus sp. O23 TaxID=2009338 RepID=UPI000B4E5E91|nr:aldo/keto reductase [Saccharibacillus sp. O23]OWR27110.1 aldo/keto reductase [Saccharibacillus sp. O23]
MNSPSVQARNGVDIPLLGFGVYKLDRKEQLAQAVDEAIRTGYRHFDTARIYGNERDLGEAVRRSGLDRREFFLTSKIWNTDLGYVSAKKAFERTLKKLGTDYLDMYLIHFAAPGYPEAWRALEELYEEGKVRVIGTANFGQAQLERLMEGARVLPMLNQIETHPEYARQDIRSFMDAHGILHEAWAPLGQGNPELLRHPRLRKIAEQHGKTVAQIILRWHMQRGTVTIPKSANPRRIRENFDIFGFALNESDMRTIDALDRNRRYAIDPNGYIVNPLYNKAMRLFL